jgi:hypothetical protein
MALSALPRSRGMHPSGRFDANTQYRCAAICRMRRIEGVRLLLDVRSGQNPESIWDFWSANILGHPGTIVGYHTFQLGENRSANTRRRASAEG